MPQAVDKQGAVVRVMEGAHRGRVGVVRGEADGTGSVRVVLDHLSKYDAGREKLAAWVPVQFLRLARQ